MKRIQPFLIVAMLLCWMQGALAYTAYPYLAAGSGNSGLTSGSVIGYTVLQTDGSTVVTARTTTGIVEVGTGSGYYVISNGLSVPDGTVYEIKWDRSDTSTVLGVAPTVGNSYYGAIKAKTDLIATNSADSPNAVTAQGNVTTILGRVPNTVPTAAQNAAANWQYDISSGLSGTMAGFLLYGIRSTVTPSWYTAPTDPWAATYPGTYSTGTFGYAFAHLPQSSDLVTAILANTAFKRLMALQTGGYTRSDVHSPLTYTDPVSGQTYTVTITVDGSGNPLTRTISP